MSHDGRSAKVFRLDKRHGSWHRTELGEVQGDDCYNTFAQAALQYTEHDAELFSLLGRLIQRRHDELDRHAHEWMKQADKACEALGEALVMGRRCVRS